MTLRKVLLTVVGHVDHGKTTLLDRIRNTAVAAKEAGGITQAVSCSHISLQTIEKICGPLLKSIKFKLTVPGLLFIDTPGHAAFTSLRKRGGSLADIAILVVDINEGMKPQTIESIEILKAKKVPFVVAVNKIDMINGWNYGQSKSLLENINSQNYAVQSVLEQKMYELVAQFNEHSLQAERFDRVGDYTKQLALIPLSAKTGQGIPELLMVITGLAQRFLEQRLQAEEGPAKGTILEVKEEKGLGITIDTIMYSGKLKVNDMIVIAGIEEPIVTKVRALLEPGEGKKWLPVKEVTAATGVKIAAPGLDRAIAGMPLRAGVEADLAAIKEEVQREVKEIIVEEGAEEGVIIKADTIGGLEALQTMLKEKGIPISSSSLGDITKRDLSKIESLKDKDAFLAVLLGFNVAMSPEVEECAKSNRLKVIRNNIIYRLLEDYEAFRNGLKAEIEKRELASLVRPAKIILMKGYLFRQNNPAIIGTEVEIGQIKVDDPLMNKEGKRLTSVKSMQEGEDVIAVATQGKQLALAMDGVTIGRQVQEGDFLYTDVPEDDFKKLKELKKYLSKPELEVLREIAEMKRKDNPVWGMG